MSEYKFKEGDRVVCVDDDGIDKLNEGGVYTVSSVDGVYVSVYNREITSLGLSYMRFKLANTQPHKHCKKIKAWADGAIIQYDTRGAGWLDCLNNDPMWNPSTNYRVKPDNTDEIRKVRQDMESLAERLRELEG